VAVVELPSGSTDRLGFDKRSQVSKSNPSLVVARPICENLPDIQSADSFEPFEPAERLARLSSPMPSSALASSMIEAPSIKSSAGNSVEVTPVEVTVGAGCRRITMTQTTANMVLIASAGPPVPSPRNSSRRRYISGGMRCNRTSRGILSMVLIGREPV